MRAEQLYELTLKLKAKYPVSTVLAKEFGLEPGDEAVLEVVDLQDEKHGRVKINLATEFALKANPPFEWKLEIDDFQGEHYLWLSDGRFVRADRKTFFDVSSDEITRISNRLISFEK